MVFCAAVVFCDNLPQNLVAWNSHLASLLCLGVSPAVLPWSLILLGSVERVLSTAVAGVQGHREEGAIPARPGLVPCLN
jgi:hypothetical protein